MGLNTVKGNTNQSIEEASDFKFLIYDLNCRYDHGIDIKINKLQIIWSAVHKWLGM